MRKKNFLKLMLNVDGYPIVNFWTNGKCLRKRIHRMVAQSFIDNPYNKPMVNHIDGNKLNARVDNLEWCTDSENKLHAYKIGLLKVPKKRIEHMRKMGKLLGGRGGFTRCKLTYDQAQEARVKHKTGLFRVSLLAKEYHVSHPTMSKIIKNISYMKNFTIV